MFGKAVDIGSNPTVGLFRKLADKMRTAPKKRKRKTLIKRDVVYKNVKERGQML